MENLGKKGWTAKPLAVVPIDIYRDTVQSRMNPRFIGSGSMQGTQNVGRAGAAVDSDNNRIMLSSNDGSSVGFGVIPGTDPEEFGFFGLDENDRLVFKIVNGTFFAYNPEGLNFLQVGILPDGAGGWEIAAEGHNVADAYL